jgi:hypothetical protein
MGGCYRVNPAIPGFPVRLGMREDKTIEAVSNRSYRVRISPSHPPPPLVLKWKALKPVLLEEY